MRENEARRARYKAGNTASHDDKLDFSKKEKIVAPSAQGFTKADSSVKKDFFGRIIKVVAPEDVPGYCPEKQARQDEKERKVWVTYHEGLNNAVRKPISLQEFMKGL